VLKDINLSGNYLIMMAKTTIPVDKKTRDVVRAAKGYDRTYDDVLLERFQDVAQEEFSTDED